MAVTPVWLRIWIHVRKDSGQDLPVELLFQVRHAGTLLDRLAEQAEEDFSTL